MRLPFFCFCVDFQYLARHKHCPGLKGSHSSLLIRFPHLVTFVGGLDCPISQVHIRLLTLESYCLRPRGWQLAGDGDAACAAAGKVWPD